MYKLWKFLVPSLHLYFFFVLKRIKFAHVTYIMQASLGQSHARIMSRAFFVSEGSVAWLTPSVLQTKHSYHRVQTCDARSHSSFVSVAPGQRNVICRCPQWHKGFWVQQHNVLAYLQVQAVLPLWSCSQQHIEQYDIIRYKRLLRLYIWVVLRSDTTGFSHPHISLCLMTTQCIVLVYTIDATVTSKCKVFHCELVKYRVYSTSECSVMFYRMLQLT